MAAFTAWVEARVPVPDADGRLANAMAAAVDDDPALVRVEQVAARLAVSVALSEALEGLDLQYPRLDDAERAALEEARKGLAEE